MGNIVSYLVRKIQAQIKYAKDSTKLSDLEIIRNSKNIRDEKWCRKVVIIDKYTMAIFSSDAMLSKLRSKLKQLFIDGSFKVPKPFTQLLTFYLYDETINIFAPVFFVLTNSKEQLSYDLIFNEINSILFVLSKQNRQQYELNFDIVTTDFELALINSVKNNMMNLMQKGCYFHFLQAL